MNREFLIPEEPNKYGIGQPEKATHDQKSSPCNLCQLGGKHLDAPPCTSGPAEPKSQSASQPITMDVLRSMVKKPVYIHRDIFPDDCGWRIVKSTDVLRVYFTDGSSLSFTDYDKSWLAYLNEPEVERHVYPQCGVHLGLG